MKWHNIVRRSASRMVGYEIPLSSDHYGHFDLNNGIRFGKKVEQYRLAWLEDIDSLGIHRSAGKQSQMPWKLRC